MATTSTKHLIDPELIPLLDMLPPLNPTRESLPHIRAIFKEMAAQMLAALPESPDISVSEHHIPGPQGEPDVRVLVYLPKNASTPTPALLWMHGGGYLWDNADRAYPLVKGLIAATGCAAVAVDYRLAPETSHPGPVEDCYAALKWLYTHAEKLSVDASRIAIGGESSGAGLAATLALLTRDRGEVPLIFQLLMYPMLDDRTATATDHHPYTGEYIWTAESNRFAWTALLGEEPGGANISPYAAPARAERLEGLPPAFIGVGTLDLFLEEDLEYARRLTRAGVPAELHVYPGAFHVFNIAENARVAQAFTRDSLNALTRAFTRNGGREGIS
ncbi:MAG TPA: alpha/beta hydrolase [Ktedonobacteraceae bacterium]|nr:alpha/beta hydrolase [Ktedonobacteraceae bacterium]